jgi:hypothetical protein
MSRTDDPSSDPNPPTTPGGDDAREDVDDMDDRVFGGSDEDERQEAERSAVAEGSDADAPDGGESEGPTAGRAPGQTDADPMAGESPSG